MIEYLASPYTHPDPQIMERRFQQAMTCTAKLIHEGRIIYSPILHFHPIALAHDLPKDFSFWQEINKQILSRCDRLLVLKLSGWNYSEGVQGEMHHAFTRGIEVQMLEPAAWLI